MQEIILSVMGKYGYVGVFLLIMIENVFPPIPSEVILLFGGFMTTYTKLSIFGMVVASTLGSLFGAIILYYIGKIFNKDRLKKIISGKLGKILRLKVSDIDNADNWFDNKGNKTVFFVLPKSGFENTQELTEFFSNKFGKDYKLIKN